jgi:tetratricopeptide (TPR) repeat protein
MKKLILMCLFLSVNLVYGQQLADKIADKTCECFDASKSELIMDSDEELKKCFIKSILKYRKKIEKELGVELDDEANDSIVESFMQKVFLRLLLKCDIFQTGPPKSHEKEGNKYFENKEYELALAEYKQIPKNDRGNMYHNDIGLCYYYLKDNFNAVVNLFLALEYEPNSPIIYYNLSKSLVGLGKYDEALNAMDSAIFYNPEEADYYFQKGKILYQPYKLHEADSLFRIAIAIDSNNALYYSELANLHYYADNTTSSISLIEKAISLDEANANLYYSLATFLFSIKEYDMAIDNLEKYNLLSPESSEGNYKLIECYLAMGNTEMAKSHLQKMLETDSNNYVLRQLNRKMELEIAQRDLDLGNYEAALEYANATIEKDSVYGNYSFRAEIHRAKENYQAAINDYSKIIEKDPCRSCKYFKLRSESYTKLKMAKEAENDLQIWNLLGCEKRSEIDYGYDYEGLDEY